MKTAKRYSFLVMGFFLFVFFAAPLAPLGAQPPCCAEDPALSYFLFPKPSQKYQYLVRYETFFSKVLGKEKGFFIRFFFFSTDTTFIEQECGGRLCLLKKRRGSSVR